MKQEKYERFEQVLDREHREDGIAIRHLLRENPPVCLHILGQNMANNLHAEGRKVLKQRDELLAACKALLTMSGGPEGLDMGGPIDPREVRMQAVKAIESAVN